MSVAVLVDTNVLVYLFDHDEPEKRTRAAHVIAQLTAAGTGAVTAQVLGEFFTVVRRRFPVELGLDAAIAQVGRYADQFAVFDTTAAVVLEALRGVARYQFSYYDAQIWACARVNRIPLVLSEDFADGVVIEGVRFTNPFAEGASGLE